mgnify:CR=1 FL=1
MFNYTDDDGNFIIESGSNAVPIMKVSGSVVYISGSIIPFESTDSAFSEIGTLAKPFKELYVESASINFIDTRKAVGHADRKVRFSRGDVEKLKRGESINDSGVLSASGDMHVVGDSTFRGISKFDGITSLRGETQVTGALLVNGAADFKGHFRINGTRLTEAELTTLQGITATTAELNKIDGFTGVVADLNYAKDLRATGVTSTEFNKLDGYTGDHNDLNYAKDLRATGVTTTEFDYLDGVTSNIQTQIDNAGGGGSVSGDTYATDLKIGRDSHNYLDFSTDNRLLFKVNNSDTLVFSENVFRPGGSLAVSLGEQAKQWNALWVANISASGAISASGNFRVEGHSAFNGTFRYNSSPVAISGTSNQIIDARLTNTFYANNSQASVVGIRGTDEIGQIVTIFCMGANRIALHAAETGVSTEHQLQHFAGRDISLRAPNAIQYISYGAAGWVRL